MEVKNVLLGILIAVIFLMFAVYGTKLVYDSPEYGDFCNDSYYYPSKIGVNCTFSPQLQNETNECYRQGGMPRYNYDNNGCEKNLNMCDFCNLQYEEANENYTKNLFLISLILGLIVVAISVIFIKVQAVSGGLMLGSLSFMVYGTAGYWRFMDDLLRFVILGIVLFILIWLAYYLAKKKIGIKKKKRKKR